MKRKFVSSSAVRSIGYDEKLHLLEIEYMSGQTYRYYFVPKTEYEQLAAAPSKGTYVNRRIKPRYPFKKSAA